MPLRRLGVSGLDTLLLHAPADLTKTGKEHLESWMLGLRDVVQFRGSALRSTPLRIWMG